MGPTRAPRKREPLRVRRAVRGAILAVIATAVACSPATGDAATVRLRIPFPQADGTLTPYTFQLGYPLMTLVYDTLMWRDHNGVPRPWLARSARRTGDEVIVRLRQGARWQDGVPVSAGDVVFTYRYLATHPHPRFTPELAELKDVEEASPDTVVFTLSAPSLGFEDQPLADVPILPRHLWEGLPADRLAPPGLPMGSGPYRLVSYDAARGYRFLANPHYFRGPPAVGEIDVPIIHDAQATFNALQAGKVDMVPVGLTPDAAGQLTGELGVSVSSGDDYTGTVLMLNTRAPPFNVPAARRAVAAALDPDAIAAALGTVPGGPLAVPADHGLIDPASPWAPRHALRVFNRSAARVALAEQGEPPITVLAPDNDPVRLDAARQVVAALQSAGARATLDPLRPEALQRAVGEDGYTPSFQAAIWATPALVSYDPSFLAALFGAPLRTPLNYGGYTSDEFDRLAAAVEAAPTRAARHVAVDRELALLSRDAPVVPLYFTRATYAFRPTAWNGWRYVKGSGLLDKQSFLRRRSSRRGAAAPPAPTGAVASQDSGASTLLWFGAAIVLILAVAGTWRWLHRGR